MAKLSTETVELREALDDVEVLDITDVKELNDCIKEMNACIDITDFPKEMYDCIEFDKELDRYFGFLSNLSREELLAIVKYEVYNRVLIQQNFDISSEVADE